MHKSGSKEGTLFYFIGNRVKINQVASGLESGRAIFLQRGVLRQRTAIGRGVMTLLRFVCGKHVKLIFIVGKSDSKQVAPFPGWLHCAALRQGRQLSIGVVPRRAQRFCSAPSSLPLFAHDFMRTALPPPAPILTKVLI